MKRLGEIRNADHDGLFVLVCDSRARYGGWDEHGDRLADEGSMELDLGGLRAFVEEAHGSGSHEVLASDDGTIWLHPPLEPGVTRIPTDRIETEPRTERVEMGAIDVPSGVLTIALAYSTLNGSDDMHAPHERVDIPTDARAFSVVREFAASGQIVALKRM